MKHFQLIVFRKLLGWKLEKSDTRFFFASPRPPPKISLKHDWKRELGSEVAQRPDGQVVQQFKSSQLNQPNSNPDHDRTEQPVVGCDTSHEPGASQTRSSDDSKSFNVGDETIHDRTGQPVVNRDESGHKQTLLNEANMDFRIPGLPHSVVKQAESFRVLELVEKIENHPDRHALQLDLQQKQSLQPVQCDVKENDLGRGQRRAI